MYNKSESEKYMIPEPTFMKGFSTSCICMEKFHRKKKDC